MARKRVKVRQPEIPIYRVSTRGWPRAMNMAIEAADGSWRARLRCPDGVVRRFKTPARGAERLPRQAMTPRRRFEVFARDDFRCRYCGREAPMVELHVDHVLAVANGGTDDDANLVAACQDCNLGKSDRILARIVAQGQ